MANTIKYIAFNVDHKRRVKMGGGVSDSLPKIILNRGDILEFRILCYKNKDDFYTTSSTTFALRVREKRISSDDLASALSSTFIDANWLSGEGVKQISVYDAIGEFLEGDNIEGATSGALGSVIGYSKETGALIYQNTSGTFTDGEIIKVLYGGSGYSGVYARAGDSVTSLSGSKANGKMSCTISLNSTELSDFMVDKEKANFVLELEEVDGDDVQKLLGQCEVQIYNSFLVDGATALTDNSYFPLGW